jgi:hypothetical protein
MRRLVPITLMVLAAAVLMTACVYIDTPPVPVARPHAQTFQNLTHKSDVLNNFELAHIGRDTSHYDALLDDNFTFFYTDVNLGTNNSTPVQWGRDTDIQTTHALFAAASKIDMDVDFHDGVTWSEVPSGAENWYAATMFYHFEIKIGDTTYIPNAGAKMLFTVRNAGTAEAPHWKLVELRDLGGPSVFSTKGPASGASTEPTTYGKVKALYRP